MLLTHDCDLDNIVIPYNTKKANKMTGFLAHHKNPATQSEPPQQCNIS